jgi:putative sterol carrier protein
MTVETATEAIRAKIHEAAGLGARVKFDFGGDGIVLADATQTPPVVSHDDSGADLTVSCSLETFEEILSGALDPNVAFMLGRLRIRGNMQLAMKLNNILEA